MEVTPHTEVTRPTKVTISLISSYGSHFHLCKSFSTMEVNNYNHESQF